MFLSTILEHVLFEEAWLLTEHSQDCAAASWWWSRLFPVRCSGLSHVCLGITPGFFLFAVSSMPVFTIVSWLCIWKSASLLCSWGLSSDWVELLWCYHMLQRREAGRDAGAADQDEECGCSTHLVTLPAWAALEIGTGVPVSQVQRQGWRKTISKFVLVWRH